MIKSRTVWVNKSSLGVMNGIVEDLNRDIIGWQATCGFRNGYSEKNFNGRELVYVEIYDKDEDLGSDNIAYNRPDDVTENPDGTLNEKIYINQDRLRTKAQWMGTILHELLHRSDEIANAASILADKFFDDAGEPCNTEEENPLGLSASQKQRARAIIEEIIVRRRVNQIAKEHPNVVAPGPINSVDEYNEPGDLDPLELLSPAQANALQSFMDNHVKAASSPCNLSKELPLKPLDCRGVRVESLFVAAEENTSPLVLDLDGDGVETLGQNFYIHFDHDKNGFAERTGWAGADDGLLVVDRNGNGSIDNGSELFGNNSGTGPGPANGFAALAEFDSNLDGRIDTSDTAFASLRVWKDANSNGLTDAGELLTLQQTGVGSLTLTILPDRRLMHRETAVCSLAPIPQPRAGHGRLQTWLAA